MSHPSAASCIKILSEWKGRRILLAISGGIAAYKICQLASTLGKAGADVRAILTDSAQQFVTPLSFSTLCRQPALTDADFWNATQSRPLHIELGEWAEVMLIAPLTANTLAKLAHGAADNLLTNTVLASTCPVLLAPAMNTDMWEQQAVQKNWKQLQTDPRFHSAAPVMGLLACDRQGTGRMAEPAQLLAQLESLLHQSATHRLGERDLTGKHILISGGGTQEFIDAVRFIGNPSTGRMGVALALAAHHRGAQVTLVHGPMHSADLAIAQNIPCHPVTTAAEMQQALETAWHQQDWLLMAAAVADLKPSHMASTKLAKAELPNPLPLTSVPDLVSALAHRKQPQQKLIGFAAQTGNIIPPALGKLQRKGLDAIVANPVDQAEAGFGGDRNQGQFIPAQGEPTLLTSSSKLTMAHRIYDAILKL